MSPSKGKLFFFPGKHCTSSNSVIPKSARYALGLIRDTVKQCRIQQTKPTGGENQTVHSKIFIFQRKAQQQHLLTSEQLAKESGKGATKGCCRTFHPAESSALPERLLILEVSRHCAWFLFLSDSSIVRR